MSQFNPWRSMQSSPSVELLVLWGPLLIYSDKLFFLNINSKFRFSSQPHFRDEKTDTHTGYTGGLVSPLKVMGAELELGSDSEERAVSHPDLLHR